MPKWRYLLLRFCWPRINEVNVRGFSFARAIFPWWAFSWLDRSLSMLFVDNSPNMHNTGFFQGCILLSVTNVSIWILCLVRYSEIFKKPNFQVGARGKRRGFSPGAAARHRSRTRVLTDFQSRSLGYFLTEFVIWRLPRVCSRKIWDRTKSDLRKSEKRRGKRTPLKNNTQQTDKICGTLVRLLWRATGLKPLRLLCARMEFRVHVINVFQAESEKDRSGRTPEFYNLWFASPPPCMTHWKIYLYDSYMTRWVICSMTHWVRVIMSYIS